MKSILVLGIIYLLIADCSAQSQSSSPPIQATPTADSVLQKDTVISRISYEAILQGLLSKNKFINYRNAEPPLMIKKLRKGKEWIFYLFCIDILLLGIFKVFYTKYFNNIFRVFFNTSLRQNQLTDILLQARLPSLIFYYQCRPVCLAGTG